MSIINLKTKEVEYEGLVTRHWESNHYDYSEFYAEVMDLETGEFRNILIGEWPYGYSYKCVVDATDENVQKFIAKRRPIIFNKIKYKYESMAKTVEKGKIVEIVKGKKAPIGTIGEVFWEKDECMRRYGHTIYEYTRIGIKDSNGNVYWTYADNCKVCNWENYMPTMADLNEETDRQNTVCIWVD